jgi:hypothetical protein
MQNQGSVEGLSRLVRAGFVALLIPLAGCATAYQRENITGGYSDFRLDETTYRVRFKGNNYTSRDQVERFLLYRCAEVTAQRGYDYFVLVDQDTLDISDPFAQAGAFPHNYYATARIIFFPHPDHPLAYNAKDLMRTLRAHYPNEFGS